VSGGLALLQAFCQWNIEHQLSSLLFFPFHSVRVSTGVARGC